MSFRGYSVSFFLKTLVFSFVLVAINTQTAEAFKSGDLIFHMSKSRQSDAIREATGSPWTHMGILMREGFQWYVYEAVGPVKKTPLANWIDRGKDDIAVVKRPKVRRMGGVMNWLNLRNAIDDYMGKGYDIYFEWDDRLIYCSELAYKVYQKAFGWAPGKEERFRDFDLDGPLVRELIIKRYKKQGRELNLNETIVAPGSMFDDPSMETIYDSRTAKKSLRSYSFR